MEVRQPISTTSESAPTIDPDDSESIIPEHAPGREGGCDNEINSGEDAGMQGDGDNEDEDGKVNDAYEEEVGPDPRLSERIIASVNNTLQEIEVELGVTNRLLRDNIDLLFCSGVFKYSCGVFREPSTVETLARVNSPTSNKYVDVHFSYRCWYPYSIVWFYTIGFKISRHATPREETLPSHTDTLKTLRDRPVARRYGTQGWRSIVYALHEGDNEDFLDYWRRTEIFSVDLDMDGLVDVHEALWGPLVELPPDASEEAQIQRQEALIRGLRVLLAAVGIEYYISCRDEEADSVPGGNSASYPGQVVWMLESGKDRWLARGVRWACGFQLERDPEEEQNGIEWREKTARRDEDDDYYDAP